MIGSVSLPIKLLICTRETNVLSVFTDNVWLLSCDLSIVMFFLFVHNRSELQPVPMWSDALGVLKTAQELSQVSVTREAYLEAEILLNIGNYCWFQSVYTIMTSDRCWQVLNTIFTPLTHSLVGRIRLRKLSRLLGCISEN